MPPKKSNGYAVFVEEKKAAFAREGLRWKDPSELFTICGPLWQNLPEERRKHYKTLAKKSPKKPYDDYVTDKYDSHGRSLLSLKKEEDEKQKSVQAMLDGVRTLVDKAVYGDQLPGQNFYFIHFNIHCHYRSDYVPAEMALLQFSLEKGVRRFVHRFIYPKWTPLGSALVAHRTAGETHGISKDIEPLKDPASKSYDQICRNILDFIKVDGGPTPNLFTNADDVKKAESALDLLFQWSGLPDREQLVVYPINELFYRMTQSIVPEFQLTSANLAQNRLDTESYSYQEGMGCKFHYDVDLTLYCSLTIVKSWAYVIADHMCPYFGIPLAPESHKPDVTRVGLNVTSTAPPARRSFASSRKRAGAQPYVSPTESEVAPVWSPSNLTTDGELRNTSDDFPTLASAFRRTKL